ncbi:MAG: SDR family NAD(P)-dependent oxidoreductase, partial [Actinomycetota bacterium]|nr:SDR family NAD(P)-dependent oxidoreductase [Actinomycetota bacterium]
MQDFNDLSGTALVIGGTGGIGSEICKLLAKRGSDIAFTYQNNLEKAESLSTQINDLGANS